MFCDKFSQIEIGDGAQNGKYTQVISQRAVDSFLGDANIVETLGTMLRYSPGV